MKKTATLSNGQTIEYVHKDDPPQGGMKKVYFTPDREYALCFYKDPTTGRDPNRMARLESIIGKCNPTVTRAKGGAASDQRSADYYKDLFCWPVAIITEPSLGIVTPIYPPNFFFSSGRIKGKDKNGRWFASPKLRRNVPPGELGEWLGYLLLCTCMARAVSKLHMSGLAHSDLSNNNVLVDPVRGECSVIDIDSLVVPRRFPPDVLGTPGYIAPEVVKTRTLPVSDPRRVVPSNWTDLYALGVLIYEYLLRRHPLKGPKIHDLRSAEEDERLAMGEKALFIEHPTDHSNRPGPHSKVAGFQKELTVKIEHLGPYLSRCFTKTFVEGLHQPKKRAVATRWVDALSRTQDLLVKCEKRSCPEKWFVYLEGSPLRCPWCNWRPKAPVPVLDFHYAPRRGQYRREDHCLVAWHKRILYEWHVFFDKRMDEFSEVTGLAEIQLHRGQWLLVNRELDSMLSPSGNPVPRGQAVALRKGDEILLSRAGKGRLASVRFIS